MAMSCFVRPAILIKVWESYTLATNVWEFYTLATINLNPYTFAPKMS